MLNSLEFECFVSHQPLTALVSRDVLYSDYHYHRDVYRGLNNEIISRATTVKCQIS